MNQLCTSYRFNETNGVTMFAKNDREEIPKKWKTTFLKQWLRIC